MKNWRPPDWDEMLVNTHCYTKPIKIGDIDIPEYGHCVEAGADAMYEPAYEKGCKEEREALRKGGVPWIDVNNGIRGKLVFIPDEEADDEP
jgi:hypothetical protein